MANDKSKNISTTVIRRFMSDARFDEFIREYNSARKVTSGVTDRGETLMQPISKEDKEILRAYIEETDVPVKTLCRQYGLTSSRFWSKAHRTAIKLIYQNNLLK